MKLRDGLRMVWVRFGSHLGGQRNDFDHLPNVFGAGLNSQAVAKQLATKKRVFLRCESSIGVSLLKGAEEVSGVYTI